MRNWQDMKQLSYVCIKLTKAKSLSEGLTKCKIAKLTRNNPVYEHLILHKNYSKMKNCLICVPNRQNIQSQSMSISGRYTTSQSYRSKTQRSKTQEVLSESKQTSEWKINHNSSQDKFKSVQHHVAKTPRGQAFKAASKFYKTVDRFGSDLKKSRRKFDKISAQQDQADDYFMTAIDDIDLQINEDKGLSLREVRTDNLAMKEEIQELVNRRKKMQEKVKKLNQPVYFPLNPEQMNKIIKEDQKNQKCQTKHINKMVSSLYEYKSCKNYSKRMKTINSMTHK